MLTAKEERMIANALRCAILIEEGESRTYSGAVSEHDTIEEFKALHRKVSS